MLGSGCYVTSFLIDNDPPAAISGPTVVCTGSSISLSDLTSGGTWSSSVSAVATVNAIGNVNGVSTGSTTITYVVGSGCYVTYAIVADATPAAITGSTSVCTGSTITLADTTVGGTWSSVSSAIATIDASGNVTGVGAGSTTITYMLGTGCYVTSFIIDNDPPSAISGPTVVCTGSPISLSDLTSGGTWSSSISGVATVSSVGNVSGVSAGTATISYMMGTGCYATYTITVNATPAAITGSTTVCTGSTITLSDTTGGGTWSSFSSGVATVDASGDVTGVGSGSTTITYTVASGCYATAFIIDNDPPAAIVGTSPVCVGNIVSLTDATSGGTWSSSISGVATVSGVGNVSGVSAGIATISYMMGTGCYATFSMTVNAAPSPISGATTVCTGNTITLSDATGGGSWSSSSSGVASVDGVGNVTGEGTGSATITYSLGSGCFVTASVTDNNPPPAISGPSILCSGTAIDLIDGASGGTWSSSNTAIAIAGTGGVITGSSTGVVTISYTLASGCYASTTITVSAAPSPITGPNGVCFRINDYVW